jgi:hypothetical protein
MSTFGRLMTSVGPSTALEEAAGVAFSPTTGTAFVADGGRCGTNKLYSLDLTTGLLTAVGGLGVSTGLAGLSFAPTAPVPEPSSLATAGTVAFIGLGWFARRRQARIRGA